MEFKTIKKTAIEWNLSPRRIQILCNENRIEGACKLGGIWLIPLDALPPKKLSPGPKVGGKR